MWGGIHSTTDWMLHLKLTCLNRLISTESNCLYEGKCELLRFLFFVQFFVQFLYSFLCSFYGMSVSISHTKLNKRDTLSYELEESVAIYVSSYVSSTCSK
jgi:hypothetical protein